MTESPTPTFRQLEEHAEKLGLTIVQENNEFQLRFLWGNGIIFGNLKEIDQYFSLEYAPQEDADS